MSRDWYTDKFYDGLNAGWMTDEHCPECGAWIVYNGNYFCVHHGTEVTGGARVGGVCGWALPERPRKKADRAIHQRLMAKVEEAQIERERMRY